MKNISIIVALIVTLGGGFLAFGQLTTNQENTKEDVVELKEETKSNKERLNENQLIDREQTIRLENTMEIQRTVVEMLKEMRK